VVSLSVLIDCQDRRAMSRRLTPNIAGSTMADARFRVCDLNRTTPPQQALSDLDNLRYPHSSESCQG
jgi:hypothetical protein